MTKIVQHLKNWCTDQHELLSRSLEMMEKGLLRTSEGRVGGGMADTTEASITHTKESLAELEKVLHMIRDDAAGQASDEPGQ